LNGGGAGRENINISLTITLKKDTPPVRKGSVVFRRNGEVINREELTSFLAGLNIRGGCRGAGLASVLGRLWVSAVHAEARALRAMGGWDVGSGVMGQGAWWSWFTPRPP
jgi:hypothetical protein